MLLLPFLQTLLPESREFLLARSETAAKQHSLAHVLFAENRIGITIALWVSYFFTLAVVYLLLNWLPSFLELRGLTRPQAGMVQIMFNIGASIGSLAFGWFLDLGARRSAIALMYAGILLSLFALTAAGSFTGQRIASLAVGLFVVGGQLVLYALAPRFYRTSMRATGVGSAVAAGRVGAILGPLAGGAILGAGFTGNAAIIATMPGLVLAGAAALTLVARVHHD